MSYNCSKCRTPRRMAYCMFLCPPFYWRGYFCSVCQDALFNTRWSSRGWKLTRWLFKGEVLILGGDDSEREAA